jgi:hypothetical protein
VARAHITIRMSILSKGHPGRDGGSVASFILVSSQRMIAELGGAEYRSEPGIKRRVGCGERSAVPGPTRPRRAQEPPVARRLEERRRDEAHAEVDLRARPALRYKSL